MVVKGMVFSKTSGQSARLGRSGESRMLAVQGGEMSDCMDLMVIWPISTRVNSPLNEDEL